MAHSLAIFALYVTTLLAQTLAPDLAWPVAFAVAMLIGALLGAINGVFIAFLKLPWVTSRMSWPSIKMRPSPSLRS